MTTTDYIFNNFSLKNKVTGNKYFNDTKGKAIYLKRDNQRYQLTYFSINSVTYDDENKDLTSITIGTATSTDGTTYDLTSSTDVESLKSFLYSHVLPDECKQIIPTAVKKYHNLYITNKMSEFVLLLVFKLSEGYFNTSKEDNNSGDDNTSGGGDDTPSSGS